MQRTVLLITYYFPPSVEVGVQRPEQIAKYLPEFGWRPLVLTIHPSAYRDSQRIDSKGGTADADVHRTTVVRPAYALPRLVKRMMFWRSRAREGTTSTPPPQPSSPEAASRRNPLYRVSAMVDVLFGTPDEEVGWFPFALAKARKLLKTQPVDAIFTTSPPHSAHLIGSALKRRRDIPWIADFQDPWMLNPWRFEDGHESLQYRVQARLERQVFENADRLVFNTPRALSEHVERYGEFLRRKSTAIPNGFDPGDLEGLNLQSHSEGTKSQLTLLHAGSLYDRRDPLPLIEAVYRLYTKGILSRDNFHLTLLGKATMERQARARIEELGLTDIVEMLPPVPHQECLRRMHASELLLIIQPGTKLQVPAKLYEYTYMRKPVLAIAEPDGAAAELIEKHGVGLTVPNRAEEIADALIKLYQDFQQDWAAYGYSAFPLHEHNAHNVTRQLADVLSESLR